MRIVLALVCMVSVAAADVPTTNVDVEQAHTRYLLQTGKGLTGTAITLGVLAFGLGLGLGLAPVTFMGDHPLRDFVAVPLSCSLAGLSAIFITIGAPIWGAGERAERRAKTKVVVAANGLQVAF